MTFRDRAAQSLSQFGILGTIVFIGITATVTVFTPLTAALVLVWSWASRTPWREIGLARPRSWIGGAAIGVGLGLAEKFTMKAIVLPLLKAPAVNSMFGDLAANPRRAVFLVFYVVIGAGFCEELFFRGYLFERLGKLWGDSVAARVLTVLVTTAFFAGLHYPQGLAGIENAAIGGVLSALVYLASGKRLWIVFVMHATFDLASLALAYFHIESLVAHSVFG